MLMPSVPGPNHLSIIHRRPRTISHIFCYTNRDTSCRILHRIRPFGGSMADSGIV